jgi:hypothetical protein
MASVLGVSTDHAARTIRDITKKRTVRGVDALTLMEAMGRFSAQTNFHPVIENYESLAQWLRNSLPTFGFRGEHLILIFGRPGSSHYGTVRGGMYQCNISKVPVAFEDIPIYQRDCTIFGVVEVLKCPLTVPVDPIKGNRAALAQAKRIAQKFGIEIEKSGDRWFSVYCPELEHDDPLEGRNETSDAHTLLAMVSEYRDCLRGGYLEAVTDPCMF